MGLGGLSDCFARLSKLSAMQFRTQLGTTLASRRGRAAAQAFIRVGAVVFATTITRATLANFGHAQDAPTIVELFCRAVETEHGLSAGTNSMLAIPRVTQSNSVNAESTGGITNGTGFAYLLLDRGTLRSSG